MKRLNILLLSLYAPHPPYDGGTVRTFELLRAIAGKHHVTFLSTYNQENIDKDKLIAHLSPLCGELHLVNVSNRSVSWSRTQVIRDMASYPPISITKHITQEYIKELSLLLRQKYDLIVCNSILSGQALNWADLSVNAATPRVLDTVDIFALMYSREYKAEPSRGLVKLWKYINWQKITYYEHMFWRKCAGIIAISPDDLRTLKRSNAKKETIYIPNGIQAPERVSTDDQDKDIDVLIVGRLDYAPNIEAIIYFDKHILPLLVAASPQVQVAIIGKNAGERIKKLLDKTKNYLLFSDVPDMSEFYRRARIAAVPIVSGSGIKIKLLEGLAHGCPVVTTSMGAYGIPVIDHQHVLIGDTPQEFAGHILNLMNSPERCTLLAKNGRNLMMQHYDWNNIKAQYVGFIEKLAAC